MQARHFRVTAHRRGECPRHLDLIAFTQQQAITTALELLPGYLISTPTAAPMWQDGPA
jgi:hypothetical protein